MSEPHSHVPYGEDGSGFYSNNLDGCQDVTDQRIPDVLKMLEDIPFTKADEVFTVCDFGCADGGTSMPLWIAVIKWLKDRYGSDQEVHVIYEDQPVNDFKSVLMRVHGLMGGLSTYMTMYDHVFASVVGTSFYRQVVPSNTVHLAFSSTAMHWLSSRPCILDGAIHHVCCTNPTQVKVYAEHAAKDWETNMMARAAELKPGGKLYVISLCTSQDGWYLGYSSRSEVSMFQQMTECWAEMREEGKITPEEHNDAQINNYYRKKDEFHAPFRPGQAVYEAGLRLVKYEERMVKCPFPARWLKEGNTDDAAAARAHAASFMPSVRVWSNYSFLSALGSSRTEADRLALVDEFYNKYEQRVAAAPQHHHTDFFHAYILIEKVL